MNHVDKLLEQHTREQEKSLDAYIALVKVVGQGEEPEDFLAVLEKAGKTAEDLKSDVKRYTGRLSWVQQYEKLPELTEQMQEIVDQWKEENRDFEEVQKEHNQRVYRYRVQHERLRRERMASEDAKKKLIMQPLDPRQAEQRKAMVQRQMELHDLINSSRKEARVYESQAKQARSDAENGGNKFYYPAQLMERSKDFMKMATDGYEKLDRLQKQKEELDEQLAAFDRKSLMP